MAALDSPHQSEKTQRELRELVGQYDALVHAAVTCASLRATPCERMCCTHSKRTASLIANRPLHHPKPDTAR